MKNQKTPSPKTKTSVNGPRQDTALLEHIVALMEEKNISLVKWQQGDMLIEVERGGRMMPNMAAPMMAPMVAPISAAPVQTPGAAPSTAPAGDAPGTVKSPVVGTVYLSPKPSEPNFVKVGDKIKEGTVLMIVEAMKVMNQITATKAGTVQKILVENEEPVEFGQPLVVIN